MDDGSDRAISAIKERLERVPAPAPDPQRVRRRGRTLRVRRRALVATVAIVLIAAVVAPLAVLWPLGSNAVPVRPTPSQRVFVAPAFGPTSGWTTRTAGAVPISSFSNLFAWAVSVPPVVERPGGGCPYRTLAALPPGGIEICAMATDPRSWRGDVSFPVRSLPLLLSDGQYQTRVEGWPRPRYRLGATVNGWDVEVFVTFGSNPPDAPTRALAQRELATLVVVPPPPTRPEPLGGYPPPTFGPGSAWSTWDSSHLRGYRGDGFASAATVPLPADARNGCPDELAASGRLPVGGVLLCASLARTAWAPLPPSHEFPDGELPITVASALIEPIGSWQDARQWDLAVRVHGQYLSVEILIGGLHPSAEAIALADRELATLSVPSP